MKKAFTLTELLVVVILVGILASLAIPKFAASTDRAMESEAKIALSQVQELQRVYFLEHKTYTLLMDHLGFEQEKTVVEDPEKGTARYRIKLEKADADMFLAVAEPVVEGPRTYEITHEGKPRVR